MKSATFVGGGAVLALSLLGSQLAVAGEPIVQSVVVSYGDLNPSDSAGASALYERIHRAALKVCTLDGEVGHLVDSRDRAQCVRRAIDQAVVAVNSPALVAFYRAKSAQTTG